MGSRIWLEMQAALTLGAYPQNVLPEDPCGRVHMILRLASSFTDEDGVVHEPILSVEDARSLLLATPDTRP